MLAALAGRFLFALGILVFLSVFCIQAFSKDLSVFAAQRMLPLSPKDANLKDFYIDGGTDEGLKAGMMVIAIRRVPLHDPTTGRSLGDLHLPVAKMKIIFSERKISVARVASSLLNSDKPLVDFDGVMVGDRVELGSASDGEANATETSEAPKEASKESDEVRTPSSLKKESLPAKPAALPELKKAEAAPVPMS